MLDFTMATWAERWNLLMAWRDWSVHLSHMLMRHGKRSINKTILIVIVKFKVTLEWSFWNECAVSHLLLWALIEHWLSVNPGPRYCVTKFAPSFWFLTPWRIYFIILTFTVKKQFRTRHEVMMVSCSLNIPCWCKLTNAVENMNVSWPCKTVLSTLVPAATIMTTALTYR